MALKLWEEKYLNTKEINDLVHDSFTHETNNIAYLKSHRDWVEENKFGFGERAFHYMWVLILDDINNCFGKINACEIGVYKGQIISLWSLIAKNCNYAIDITAISPFEGNVLPVSKISRKIKQLISKKFRNDLTSANFYGDANYSQLCTNIFEKFSCNFEEVTKLVGYSTDPDIIAQSKNHRFNILYIDGDHSFDVSRSDVENYAPLVVPNGILVMDDASMDLEMSAPYKGLPGPSKSAKLLSEMGFENILNVNHNRVFRKL
ncbi:MAG: class I SAM-dependent methyltransferase [Anaerolineae bacterium]|nr:class I SAM-dependent methyltransferase [Gloeobacterales cyanobacterium ES-bin-313]